MFKRIIFTSSYSSQIGSFLALKEYQLNIKSYDQKNNILIVQINTKNDLQCKYSFFNEYSSLLSQSGYVFTVFKVNNFIKRIIVYFLIILINNFFNKTKIELWEPRPEWINSLFKTKFIKLPRILRNKKINYYGDGFLCLAKSKPFWLDNKKLKMNYGINKLSNFFYHFEVEESKVIKQNFNNYYEIESSKIQNFLNKIIYFDINTIEKKYEIKDFQTINNLIIFPLTTFSETRRSTLNDEIKLYLDYFKQNIGLKDNLIIIKSHPNSSYKKMNRLYSELKNLKYNLIFPKKFEKIINLKIPLEIIPMELLCMKIYFSLDIAYEKIIIPLTSNVTLSTLKIFPDIKYSKPFGSYLIKKYLKKEYVTNRLKQEELIIKKIKNLYV